ncbi:hypothetical protein AB0F95_23355 [Micromonospora tulbaghiae]|uniref:hypothetical protein n=1 Tax=Micromonospora tulbaghiae TaxID=479978 RepID=UPI0033D0ADCA
MSASLVAPSAVTAEIDQFGQAVQRVLEVTTGADTTIAPLSQDQFEQAMVAPARAQLALVNAMRRSVGRKQGPLSTWLGGANGSPPHWKTTQSGHDGAGGPQQA